MKKKWYNDISNWLAILITIILVPVLIINCSIIFQANTNEDKIPSVFGYKPFIVLSDSMESAIRKGDLIFVKNIEPRKLVKDDVIAFRDSEGTVTTHRIIDIVENDGEKYFVTKGDNNNSQDQNLVEYKDVEGIYKMRLPVIGNIFNALASPTIIIILVLVITICFGLAFYASTKRQRDKEHEEYLALKKKKKLEEEILEDDSSEEKKKLNKK
ncbi:MAG: signal peptidase I [Bacilli bacterium]|nr:signal peptidase I [Bacilli bacterium]